MRYSASCNPSNTTKGCQTRLPPLFMLLPPTLPRPESLPAARPHLRGVASGGSGALSHDAHAGGGHGASALIGGGASGPGGTVPGQGKASSR